MSLTRDEWVEMWKCIKYIEDVCKHQLKPMVFEVVESNFKTIKNQIQSVIGQMENN